MAKSESSSGSKSKKTPSSGSSSTGGSSRSSSTKKKKSQTKKKTESGSFFDELSKRANEYAKKGLEYSHLARDVSSETAKELSTQGQQRLKQSMELAKKYMASTERDLETLERLADLREAGVITEEEFEEKKKQILSRL